MTPFRHARAVTLIELLLVIAIIGILAALLLGPASRALQKARAGEWANRAEIISERLVDSLATISQAKEVKERLTPQQLWERKIIDAELLQFLGDRRVSYYPFITADPDSMAILRVDVPRSFLGDDRVIVVKRGRLPNR